jgi:hypothetical protein
MKEAKMYVIIRLRLCRPSEKNPILALRDRCFTGESELFCMAFSKNELYRNNKASHFF